LIEGERTALKQCDDCRNCKTPLRATLAYSCIIEGLAFLIYLATARFPIRGLRGHRLSQRDDAAFWRIQNPFDLCGESLSAAHRKLLFEARAHLRTRVPE